MLLGEVSSVILTGRQDTPQGFLSIEMLTYVVWCKYLLRVYLEIIFVELLPITETFVYNIKDYSSQTQSTVRGVYMMLKDTCPRYSSRSSIHARAQRL